MSLIPRPFPRFARTAVVLLASAGVIGLASASDHNDGNGTFPGWDMAGRRDANITDFFAFRAPFPDEDKLVLVLTLNQGIADPGYFFAEDLTFRFHIDNHSEVIFGDGDPTWTTDDWMMRFGGTVSRVDQISADIVFQVTFEPTPEGRTAPKLSVEGLPGWVGSTVRIFPQAGESPLRRSGRAVLALEVPLALVVGGDNPNEPPAETLLIWATSKVPEINGPLSDHAGMPNTSNQHLNLAANRLRPRDHAGQIVSPPPDLFLDPDQDLPVSLAPYADVLIYDLTRDANGFPPGRGNPNLPPPPGFVQFDPYDPTTRFPNGRPIEAALMAVPFVFPFFAPQ